MPQRLGNRLRAARVAAGFHDIKAYAELLHIKISRYQKIESAKEAPTLDELSYIATITNKTIDFLVRGFSSRKLETITPILVGIMPALMLAATAAELIA